MTEPAYQQTLYPLILALSVALFLHVALATLVSGWLSLPDPESPDPRVRVRLAIAGGQPGRQSVQATPADSSAGVTPVVPPHDDAGETDAAPADATTPEDTQRSTAAGSAPPDSAPRPHPRDKAADETTTSTQSSPLAPGTASPVAGTDTATPVTRLSQDESHQRSDYELKLWEKIAGQVDYTPLIAELDGPREVVLQLRLMANGALRRATIETSSGVADLDRVAHEAALAATPFPDPPEGRRRFSVRLIFEPDAR